jgi:hypothetical protein
VIASAATDSSGAGIGGGPGGTSGTITINGGKVTATGGGEGGGGAGIGGGGAGGASDKITISGSAVVTATGGINGGAGIGGGGEGFAGRSGAGGIITITDDADVTATGGNGSTAGTTPVGGGAGIGSGGNNADTPAAAGTIVIDTTIDVQATGGSVGGPGAGANIGQGGYIGSPGVTTGNGIGIQTFDGPTPPGASVALGGTASFTCMAEPMPDTVIPSGDGLTFSASAWDYSAANPAGATTPWLSASAAWPPATAGAITGISGGGAPTTLNLSPVTASMLGYYRCAVMATALAGDLDSSILYIGQKAAKLGLPAGATPIPTLNPGALALLALALAGLAGLWRRRRT